MAFKQFDATLWLSVHVASTPEYLSLDDGLFCSLMICAMTVISFLSVLRFLLYDLGIL